MTREEFNNNSYLVNNNALYNKHTEHISTTEPLYLDGMGGSDNIVHKKSIDDGGDTPTKTLWKYEGGDAYIFGEFQEGNLFIGGPTENNMYKTNTEGRIVEIQDYNPALTPQLKTLFAPYFGEIETVQIIVIPGLTIGDTVPNWNAYEKIEGGGGDTPTQETLFAIEFEAGKFAFGHADEDEIFVATRDGFAEIWYADANGVITGYTPNADNVASAIIDAYNEHFGTDINIWTPDEDEVIYTEGEEIFNWNSYIKISY